MTTGIEKASYTTTFPVSLTYAKLLHELLSVRTSDCGFTRGDNPPSRNPQELIRAFMDTQARLIKHRLKKLILAATEMICVEFRASNLYASPACSLAPDPRSCERVVLFQRTGFDESGDTVGVCPSSHTWLTSHMEGNSLSGTD